MKSYEVTDYEIIVRSEANNPVAYIARIHLLLVRTTYFYFAPTAPTYTAAAFLNFFDTGVSLPSNSIESDADSLTYMANFRSFWFSSIVDLLSNEKPLRFKFDTGTKAAYLTTYHISLGEALSRL